MTFSHPKGVRTTESGIATHPYSIAGGFSSDLESAFEPKPGTVTSAPFHPNYIPLSMVSWMPLRRVYDNMNDGTYRPGPANVVVPNRSEQGESHLWIHSI